MGTIQMCRIIIDPARENHMLSESFIKFTTEPEASLIRLSVDLLLIGVSSAAFKQFCQLEMLPAF